MCNVSDSGELLVAMKQHCQMDLTRTSEKKLDKEAYL